VGPNATDDQRRALGRRSDVVITTKQLTDANIGVECPQISYYADTSIALFEQTIRALLEHGDLDLAVVRPTNACPRRSGEGQRGIRIMPTEDSLSPHGSHFGIARIVYDVLRVQPDAVELVGVDMFTAPTKYRSVYRVDDVVYTESAFVRVLSEFDHDFADDHMMLSALLRAGTINADPSTTAVLTLDLDAYLKILDEEHYH
jgi:hypothetical protein